jgi:hypothetical protein
MRDELKALATRLEDWTAPLPADATETSDPDLLTDDALIDVGRAVDQVDAAIVLLDAVLKKYGRVAPRAAQGDIKAGQHYVCKYKDNSEKGGDLIVGRVISMRRNGDVIFANLLTMKRAVKHVDVLMRRNFKTGKRQAQDIVAAYASGGKSAARAAAVRLFREIRADQG